MRILQSLLLIVCTTAIAQTMSSVIITVRDPGSGAALAGATVTLTGETGSPVSAVSDANGVARFQVAPGTYRVTAALQGCATERKTLTVGTSETRFELELGRRPGSVWDSDNTPLSAPPLAQPTRAPRPANIVIEPSPIIALQQMSSPRLSYMRRVPIDVEPGKNYAVVKVYYATDRAYTGETAPAKLYGPQRGNLRLGIARISVPREHGLGEMEEPSILRFEFRPDPARHVILLSVSPQRPDDFYAKLSTSVHASGSGETFVFIHGYNVTFENAARRTAQIKYDLGFDGPAILYSWPSWGETAKYPADEKNAAWAASDLTKFLTDLSARSGATSIHLVAHSMGNRVLAEALKTLANAPTQPHFDQIVMAAPDLDADVFKRDLAPAFMKLSKHVTLYASSGDKALVAGKKYYDNMSRLGDSGSGIVVMPPMETIDVSGIDSTFIGHSYVAENRTVLSDVFCLIHGTTQAASRCRLKPVGKHWKFVGAMEQLTSLASYRCNAASCLIR